MTWSRFAGTGKCRSSVMSSKVEFKLDLQGVNELMKRQELQDMMQEMGEQIASRAESMSSNPKAEYESETKTINWIAVTNIRAVNHAAFQENLDNNTLLRAMQ